MKNIICVLICFFIFKFLSNQVYSYEKIDCLSAASFNKNKEQILDICKINKDLKSLRKILVNINGNQSGIPKEKKNNLVGIFMNFIENIIKKGHKRVKNFYINSEKLFEHDTKLTNNFDTNEEVINYLKKEKGIKKDKIIFKKWKNFSSAISDDSTIYSIGDLHGSLEDILGVLCYFIDKLLNNEDITLVFKGDYVDRKFRGLEVQLILLTLKHFFGEKIILMRGNHETKKMYKTQDFGIEIGFFKDKQYDLKESYENNVDDLLDQIDKSFNQKLSLLTITKDITIMHGGIAEDEKGQIVIGMKSLDGDIDDENSYPFQLVWNDPIPFSVEYENCLGNADNYTNKNCNFIINNERGGANIRYFTQKTFYEYLEKSKTTIIIRGHQRVPKSKAIIFNGEKGKLITVHTAKLDKDSGGFIYKVTKDLETELITLDYDYSVIEEYTKKNKMFKIVISQYKNINDLKKIYALSYGIKDIIKLFSYNKVSRKKADIQIFTEYQHFIFLNGKDNFYNKLKDVYDKNINSNNFIVKEEDSDSILSAFNLEEISDFFERCISVLDKKVFFEYADQFITILENGKNNNKDIKILTDIYDKFLKEIEKIKEEKINFEKLAVSKEKYQVVLDKDLVFVYLGKDNGLFKKSFDCKYENSHLYWNKGKKIPCDLYQLLERIKSNKIINYDRKNIIDFVSSVSEQINNINGSYNNAEIVLNNIKICLFDFKSTLSETISNVILDKSILNYLFEKIKSNKKTLEFLDIDLEIKNQLDINCKIKISKLNEKGMSLIKNNRLFMYSYKNEVKGDLLFITKDFYNKTKEMKVEKIWQFYSILSSMKYKDEKDKWETLKQFSNPFKFYDALLDMDIQLLGIENFGEIQINKDRFEGFFIESKKTIKKILDKNYNFIDFKLICDFFKCIAMQKEIDDKGKISVIGMVNKNLMDKINNSELKELVEKYFEFHDKEQEDNYEDLTMIMNEDYIDKNLENIFYPKTPIEINA